MPKTALAWNSVRRNNRAHPVYSSEEAAPHPCETFHLRIDPLDLGRSAYRSDLNAPWVLPLYMVIAQHVLYSEVHNMISPKVYLRRLLKDSFIWHLRENRRQQALVNCWQKLGKPIPPPEYVKRTTLADYGSAFGLEILVETGTFLGDAIHHLKRRFKAIYSIELSQNLADLAQRRFRALPHIHILQGDSAQVLPSIMSGISTPCLFWLDGHYSGGITAQADVDTPILKELRTIFDHPCKDHVILIDDARHFDGTHDYPTIDGLRELCAKERPQQDFSVANDMIRIHPSRKVKTIF